MVNYKFSLTEILTISVSVLGVLCYFYNYAYWATFGINIYDYMSYSEAFLKGVKVILLFFSALSGAALGIMLTTGLFKHRLFNITKKSIELNKETLKKKPTISPSLFITLYIILFISYYNSPFVNYTNYVNNIYYILIFTYMLALISLSGFALITLISKTNILELLIMKGLNKHVLIMGCIIPLVIVTIAPVAQLQALHDYRDSSKKVATDSENALTLIGVGGDFVFVKKNNMVIALKKDSVKSIIF